MASFDPSKDKCLKEIARVRTKDTEEAIVGIYSYNAGEPKIGVTRHGTTPKGTEYHAAIGRMNYEDAQRIIPALVTALEELDSL